MSIRQRVKQLFTRREAYTAELKARQQLAEFTEDQRRTLNASRDKYDILPLPYNYEALYEWGTNRSEVLRTIIEAIIKECTRNGGGIKPRFLRRCPSCGTEFKTVKETCPDCNVETLKPDLKQKQLLEAFLEDPNRDDELRDIQISCYRFMLTCSDWYISIQKPRLTEPLSLESLRPATIYVEDARAIHICVDEHDNLGNGEYFCPRCTARNPEISYRKGERCKTCGSTDLKETAYIYIDGGVKARWARDELMHGKLDPALPGKYGVSRAYAALRVLATLLAMNQFNLDNYTDGKLAKIIGVAGGVDQIKLNEIISAAKQGQNKPVYDPNLGRYVERKLHQLFLAIQGDKGGLYAIDAMPDPEKMQSVEWFNLYKQTVCAIYGVQDVEAGQSTPGTTGQNPRMKVDINNNTTEFYQHAWADPFNNFILKQALGITDWQYEFLPVEEKDEAQDQAILASKLANIEKAIALGMKAELTDEGEVKLSGQPKSWEEKQQMQIEKMQLQAQTQPQGQQAFDGKKPFKQENIFANEKASQKIKNQFIVTELKTHE